MKRVVVYGVLLLIPFSVMVWGLVDLTSAMKDPASWRHEVMKGLENAPSDEIRMAYAESGHLWLLQIDRPKGILFGRAGSITGVADAASQALIRKVKLAEMERILKTLPSRKTDFLESVDFQKNIYIAFWRDGIFQVYEYRRDALPPDLIDLLKLFGKGAALPSSV